MDRSEINIKDYDYDLPENRIAKYPLKERDISKILVFDGNAIKDDQFLNISSHLPENSLLVFNETRVVQARLQFQKESGANIEIFCLEPLSPTKEIYSAFEQRSPVSWKCLVGNAKKWKEGYLKKILEINDKKLELEAYKKSIFGDSFEIEFSWNNEEITFADILENAGHTPLPPYLNRKAEDADAKTYQTIYAKNDGSVAAPTAGLHFTEKVIGDLENKRIEIAKVTLHVGAGTFKPVDAEEISKHVMHDEKILVKRELIEKCLQYDEKPIISVGTTTLRTLESLYWFGVRLLENKQLGDAHIKQWEAYNYENEILYSRKEILNALLSYMNKQKMESFYGSTQMIIVPGYKIRMADFLITNFHMPRSTLLLLVSAFIGDKWKAVYDHALENDYRFLSYGDSNLFHLIR
ncbi:S-adenosylmethionine:tRNA ribosyltransferase-isomerase [Bacteroidota bacterium]